MNWLLKIIAILIILDGIVLLFRPDFLKKYIGIFTGGKGIYFAAVLKAAVGAIFLYSVSDKCAHSWVIITFGILALAGAVFIVAMPQKARSIAAWFGNRNTTILRLFAIIYLLIGAILAYSS